MGNKNVFLSPSTVTINGFACYPIGWSRFNSHRSSRSNGAKLFRDQILNNIVSHSVPSGWTHRTLIEEIAADASVPIDIEFLDEKLSRFEDIDGPKAFGAPRGRVVFGFVGNILDKIIFHNHDDLEWWISDKGLNVGLPESQLSDFDRTAGGLMIAARARHDGYLPQIEYEQIADKFDEAGFKLLETITGQARSDLAEWNQKNPRSAIKTFAAAIRKRRLKGLEGLKRAVKKSLYQAADRFSRARR